MNPPRISLTLPEKASRRSPAINVRRPRTARVLLEALADDRVGDLTFLEWVHLVRHKVVWDQEHPGKATTSSTRIWRACKQDDHLREHLLHRLIQVLGGADLHALPESMLETWNQVRPLEDAHRAEVVAALFASQSAPMALLRLSFSRHMSPREMMEDANFSSRLPILAKVDATLPRVVPENPDARAEAWVLRVLREASGQAQVVSQLLTAVPKETLSQMSDLKWWIKNLYGPGQKGTRFSTLTPEAQKLLK